MIVLFIVPFGFPFSIYWGEHDPPQVNTSVPMASADSAQVRITRNQGVVGWSFILRHIHYCGIFRLIYQGPSRLVDGAWHSRWITVQITA